MSGPLTAQEALRDALAYALILAKVNGSPVHEHLGDLLRAVVPDTLMSLTAEGWRLTNDGPGSSTGRAGEPSMAGAPVEGSLSGGSSPSPGLTNTPAERLHDPDDIAGSDRGDLAARLLATPAGRRLAAIVDAARALSDYLSHEYVTHCDETPVGPYPVGVSIEHGIGLDDAHDRLLAALAGLG